MVLQNDVSFDQRLQLTNVLPVVQVALLLALPPTQTTKVVVHDGITEPVFKRGRLLKLVLDDVLLYGVRS